MGFFRPLVFFDENFPQFDSLWVIDVQYRHGGAAGLRAADEDRTVPFEMPLPRLISRIEQPHDVIAQRVAPAQVRSLMEVAPMATPAPIALIVRTIVLDRDDVFDVKRARRDGKIGKAAVLAPTVGALANELAERRLHEVVEDRSRARAFAWRMAMKSMVWT